MGGLTPEAVIDLVDRAIAIGKTQQRGYIHPVRRATLLRLLDALLEELEQLKASDRSPRSEPLTDPGQSTSGPQPIPGATRTMSSFEMVSQGNLPRVDHSISGLSVATPASRYSADRPGGCYRASLRQGSYQNNHMNWTGTSSWQTFERFMVERFVHENAGYAAHAVNGHPGMFQPGCEGTGLRNSYQCPLAPIPRVGGASS